MSDDPSKDATNDSAENDSNVEEPDAPSLHEDAGSEQEPPAASPPPPRAPGLVPVLVTVVLAAAVFWFGSKWGDALATEVGGVLQSILGAGGEEDADDDDGAGDYYTCGMHPWVVLPKPGDCPICHMKLTPIDPSKFTGEVSIDPIVVQNIGVRIGPVVSGPVTRAIRTVGTVDYDETRVRDINTKISGWIESLSADSLGAPVHQGDPLFHVYSPELFSAQEEYLLALEGLEGVSNSRDPSVTARAKDLIEASKTRLLYFGLDNSVLERLEHDREASKTLPILSPYDGIVIDKHANEGMRIDPGMRVYRIADLSKVWVMVTLYEYQFPFVEAGQSATMSLPYIPGMTFEGKVIYIYPYLEKKSRELKARLEFDNPGLVLKPGMFANIELQRTLARDRTLAAREAVIDTGERQVAFVSLGEGRFEPRDVRMGVETGDGMVEIIAGLKPGEMVVTSGQFLIDSEAKIRESLGKMIRGEMAFDQKAVAAVAGVSELFLLPDPVAKGVSKILYDYFSIGDILAEDGVDGIAGPAKAIAQEVNLLLETSIPEHEHFWHQHEEVATVRGKALELAGEADIAEARLDYSDLSVALSALVKATGVPTSFEQEVQELHCPMYREDQGGSTWLQPDAEVRNPFYGSSMLRCFDERLVLPITGVGKVSR